MATITKAVLSGSTDGRPISISGTDSTDLINVHTVSTNTNVIEDVYLWAYNAASSCAVTVSVTLGASGSDNTIKTVVSPLTDELILPGKSLKGAPSAVVSVFANEVDLVKITGHSIIQDQS